MQWSLLFYLDLGIMLLCWLLCSWNRRAGLVDAAWSFCILLNILITLLFFAQAPWAVRWILGLCSTLWFARLSWHLLRRYAQEKQEDRRYANMRRAMGNYQHLGFLLFFIFQAGLAILFSAPIVSLLQLSAEQWQNGWPIALVVAIVVMAVAFIGESMADQQLYRFKQNPDNQGKTLDQGLWRYSRHPNYFFEWLHWFAYPLVGLAAGMYWLWIYPLLMWLFLYYITGIPFSEQQALRNRGQNYRDYQSRTSIFIPWKPKQ